MPGELRDPPSGPLFAPRAFGFYAELAEHNDREWFAAHRGEYEEFVRVPLERLAERAEPRYGAAKVFRPNRDVRFTADKAPYKLNGAMTAGRVGGVYVSVSVDGLVAGGGLYEPSRDQLARAREVIADDGPPAAELAAIIDELERDGFELAGPFLKTAPRGVDRDHPRLGLLRMLHYAALRPLPREATAAEVEAAWGSLEPLLGWVERLVGPAQSSR
ncbi:DUF2461 domain-containing protein [Agromyces sp. ZXT2-6]|uniref:DUF2461 domain-containing protein n=1 Tax=Agromyces sp. ZXT2-6 TaxID=3461153 RepID=UPI004054FD79